MDLGATTARFLDTQWHIQAPGELPIPAGGHSFQAPKLHHHVVQPPKVHGHRVGHDRQLDVNVVMPPADLQLGVEISFCKGLKANNRCRPRIPGGSSLNTAAKCIRLVNTSCVSGVGLVDTTFMPHVHLLFASCMPPACLLHACCAGETEMLVTTAVDGLTEWSRKFLIYSIFTVSGLFCVFWLQR